VVREFATRPTRKAYVGDGRWNSWDGDAREWFILDVFRILKI